MIKKINKILVFINLFCLQATIFDFQILSHESNYQEVLLILQIIFFILTKLKENPPAPTPESFKKYWVTSCIIALATISVVGTQLISWKSYIHAMKGLIFGIIMTLIFLETLQTNKDRLRGLSIAGYGATLFAFLSLLYNSLGYNLNLNFEEVRISGPLDSPELFTLYIAPFFIYSFIQFWDDRYEVKHLINAIILGVIIIATKSALGIFATFSLTLIYIAKSTKKLHKHDFKITITLISMIIASCFIYLRILPQYYPDQSRLDQNQENWTVSQELLKNPETLILGHGINQYNFHFTLNADDILETKPSTYKYDNPQNIFLFFLLNFGILGLLLIVYLAYKSVDQLLHLKLHPLHTTSSKFIGVIFTAFFITFGLTSSPLFTAPIAFLFILSSELAFGKHSK